MDEVLSALGGLPPALIYVIAALLVLAETALLIGLLLPAEATLLLVGFLAYTGTLRLLPAVLLMTAAAVLGDSLAFRSGRRYGPRLRASRWGARVGEERWRRADAMLARLGGRSVFGARWLAFARTLVPRLAAAGGMPYRTFVAWNLGGVVTWVGASTVVGYLAGTSFRVVSDVLGRATGAVLLLLISMVAIVLVGRWLGRNPDPARALLARALRLPPLRWASQRYGVLIFMLTMRIGAGWVLLINLAAGIGLLFVIGYVFARVIRSIVSHSGLSAVDSAIAAWMIDRRDDQVASVAQAVIDLLRGRALILLVAAVALVLAWRSRSWRSDLISVVGTVGAFLPLVVIALVANLNQSDAVAGEVRFATQLVVVTASFCTLAWLLGRRTRWPRMMTAWTGAAVGVVLAAGARLYLGVDVASQTVTSVLFGVLWTVVFMVAWRTRDRAAGRPVTPPSNVPPVTQGT